MIPDPHTETTIDVPRLAQLLGISERTLYSLVRTGQSPVEPLHLGRRIRFATAKVLVALGLERDSAPTEAGADVITLDPRQKVECDAQGS